jgi:dolichyl-phosphate-mannose--protein O-mannosyl transferase
MRFLELSQFPLTPQQTQVSVAFSTADTFLIFLFAMVSFWIHFWTIQRPADVVFDEVHFGNFTNWYTRSEFFFDIHPPLGKLIMFLFANLSEYDGTIKFAGDNIRSYNTTEYIPLRITPAFFSAMCPALLYFCVRYASFGKCAAFAAAALACFDTSLLTEHRFILSDGLLHFFACLHLFILSFTLSIPRNTFRFQLWLILTGAALGAACSCKNTAWGLIALNAAIQFGELFVLHGAITPDLIRELTSRGFSLGIPAVSVYLFSFCVHFALLPFDGQGKGYLTDVLQRQLVEKNAVGHQLWGSRVSGPTLFWRSVRLSIIMHVGNMQITQWHPFQSRPIGWPLLTDIRVAFWGGSSKEEISCLGNVFSYYFAFAGVCALLFAFRSEKWLIAMRFVIGWAVSYFPFFLIPRTMYLYHYLIPLLIGCMAFGVALEIFVPPYFRGFVTVVASFLAVVGFVLWEPYCYGTKMWDKKIVIWNHNWLVGDQVHQAMARATSGQKPLDTKGIAIFED